MKTTEVFVEQVLVGAMVLFTAMLVFLPETVVCFPVLPSRAISLGVVLTGVCYLLGIVFDRVADTLTDDLAVHNRVRFALRVLAGTAPWLSTWVDPYPEDRLRIRGFRATEAENDYEHYLRVRIRLARAVAVYLPALSAACAVGAVRFMELGAIRPTCAELLASPPVGEELLFRFAAIPIVYAATIPFRRLWVGRGPRTDDADEMKTYASRHDFLDGERIIKPKDQPRRYRRALVYDFVWSRISVLWLFPGGFAFWTVFANEIPAIVEAGVVTGFLLSLLSIWVWWRVSGTYMTFIRDRNRFN